MIYVLDIDGTLIDSSKRHGALLRSLLDERSINYSQEVEREYLEYKRNGNTTMQYLTEVLQISNEESKEITREWVEHIEDWEWISMDVLYDDTIPFLERVSTNNTIYYLSSRQNDNNLKKELVALGLLKYAKEVFVVSPKEGYLGKANVIKNWIKHYQEPIVLIGDTEIDERAANYSNINVIILNRGFRSKKYWMSLSVMSVSSLTEEVDL